MTFEGQYLKYAEYTALGGSAIGETPFNLLEFEARRQIDIKTQNRLKNSDSVPQEVKLCVYNLINTIKTYAEQRLNSKGNISSESTDGYSVSYVTSDQISNVIKSKRTEIEDIIRAYLLGVSVDGEHIMYCGVR